MPYMYYSCPASYFISTTCRSVYTVSDKHLRHGGSGYETSVCVCVVYVCACVYVCVCVWNNHENIYGIRLTTCLSFSTTFIFIIIYLPDVTCLVQGKIQFKDVSTLDARVCRFVAICVTSLLCMCLYVSVCACIRCGYDLLSWLP